MREYKIGFDVAPWKSKSIESHTNEELLEYWRRLRLVTNSGVVDTDVTRKGWSTDMYIVELQDEILNRMRGPMSTLKKLRELVSGEDIPSSTCPEYKEHHVSIQKILEFIDVELIQEDIQVQCPGCMHYIHIPVEQYKKFKKLKGVVDPAVFLIDNGHDCTNMEFIEMRR